MAEIYLARGDAEGVGGAAARADAAAREFARSGVQVRHLRSIYVPEDETCFLLFEAASEGEVRAAAVLAELICNRVVEAYAVPGCEGGGGIAEDRSTKRREAT